jgi:predicted RNA methylase
MSFRESHNKGRLRLAHLHEVTEARGEDMAVEAHRFAALRDAEPTRAVSAFNLFQTPETLANELVRELGDLTGKRVLEPSAGLGRLYRAIRARWDSELVLVEMAPQCAAELYRETRGDTQATLVQDDFLTCGPDRIGTFDVVLMNPPFKMGRDIKHIQHALSLLNPGGLLLSLCFAGVKQTAAFGSIWKLLPADTFKSEGTKAQVAVVKIRKPL